MTAPVPLRVLLREMQADLDEAAEKRQAHLRRCGCRGKCARARELGVQVADAERRLGLTRFLNGDG